MTAQQFGTLRKNTLVRYKVPNDPDSCAVTAMLDADPVNAVAWIILQAPYIGNEIQHSPGSRVMTYAPELSLINT